MNFLLLRPHPGNDRFGLGPFFRVEPLGLEYLATALRKAGAWVTIGDLRFRPSLRRLVARSRPEVVGISCLHALEYDRVIATARAVRRLAPDVPIVVGGHAAAAYPAALACDAIDAICRGDGEHAAAEWVRAASARLPMRDVESFAERAGKASLDETFLPARDLVAQHRDRYHCLHHRPVWLVETSRGCPHRCNFCAVWSFNDRRFRSRSIDAVLEDFARTGDRVFVVDDLFFHPPARSLELAAALRRAGVRKKWILVQSRTDLVARHPELLEAWRRLAERLDIFFGFEAPTDDGLARLAKDAPASATVEAVAAARALGVGVTGNFLVDPDWDESDFERLWAFVAEHRLERAGYTLLTPLPGTPRFAAAADRLRGQPWFKYDMHHLLEPPRLGARRFFELYAETWRRSVLNLRGERGLADWLRKVDLAHAPMLARMLVRTQRMMRASAYEKEHHARGTLGSCGMSRSRSSSFARAAASGPTSTAGSTAGSTRPSTR